MNEPFRMKPVSERDRQALHRPGVKHNTTCYCGRKATVHVGYGSGCGNVCGTHKRSLLNAMPGTRVVPPIIEETRP